MGVVTSAVMEAFVETVTFPDDLLPLRVRPERRLSDEQLFELCVQNRRLRIERTADGELLIKSPTGSETGHLNFQIATQLGAWVNGKGGGVGFDSSTGFVLPNGAERSPDAAWISSERWAAISPAERKRFAPLCPDFVIELLSPSDKASDVHTTLREYLANGARLGWVVDPEARRVHVYRANGSVDVLENPARVGGETVLPGFELDLTRVW
jgi:Uma2 family endonuclease